MPTFPTEKDLIDEIQRLSARVKALEDGQRPGHLIVDEASLLPQRRLLIVSGAGVTATDDGDHDATVVTVPGGGGGGSRYQTVQDEGGDLAQRDKLDFEGAGVTAADDGPGGRTVVTIPGAGGGGGSWAGPYNITLGANSSDHNRSPAGVVLGGVVQLIGGFDVDTGFVTDPGGPGNFSVSESLGALPTELRPASGLIIEIATLTWKFPETVDPEPAFLWFIGPGIGGGFDNTVRLITPRGQDRSDSWIDLDGLSYYKG